MISKVFVFSHIEFVVNHIIGSSNSLHLKLLLLMHTFLWKGDKFAIILTFTFVIIRFKLLTIGVFICRFGEGNFFGIKVGVVFQDGLLLVRIYTEIFKGL
jgi:hypothetical protein